MSVPTVDDVSSAHPATMNGVSTVAVRPGTSITKRSDPFVAICCAWTTRVEAMRERMVRTMKAEDLRHICIKEGSCHNPVNLRLHRIAPGGQPKLGTNSFEDWWHAKV